MSIVTLQLLEVKACETNRPICCPYCKGETFQRWGGAIRRVCDPHIVEVLVYRYRCCTCRRTFRHYPSGVSQASQTARMCVLAAIGWILGMSYRGGSRYLSGFGVKLGRMSIWRDVQQRAKELERERFWKRVRVLGVDGAYVRGWGKTQPVLVVVDMGTGEPVTVGYVDEKNPQAVKKFLEPLVQCLGGSVIVTDDLASYKQVADALDLEQQICQFHVRRWVGRALHDLQDTPPARMRLGDRRNENPDPRTSHPGRSSFSGAMASDPGDPPGAKWVGILPPRTIALLANAFSEPLGPLPGV